MKRSNACLGGSRRSSAAFVLTRLFSLAACLLASNGYVHASPSCVSHMPELWLAPLDEHFASQGKGIHDFDRLIDADWRHDPLLQNVRVLKLYPSFVHGQTDSRLTSLVRTLRNADVRLALEASALSPTAYCRGQLKSDGTELTPSLLQRIGHLGGRVDYIAMNEPLLHAFRQRDHECEAEIVHAAAVAVRPMVVEARSVFPNLKVGDIEPIGGDDRIRPFISSFRKWTEEYRAVVGEKLSFFHIDVDWRRGGPWTTAAQNVAGTMAQAGIPFGIIYNGVDTDPSGEGWVAHASQHFEDGRVEGLAPAAVIFQSWAEFPKKFFSTGDHDSFADLISSYLQGGPCN